MGQIVIVEVLDRFGKVRHRQRVTNFPCRIGRAYDNDLIIDDGFVSAHHLEVSFNAENRLMARDLNSDNGLFAVAPLKRVDSMWLQSASRLRIGHTELQFFFPDHPVREVVLDRANPSFTMLFFTSWPAMILTWLLTAGIILLQAHFDSSESATLADRLVDLLPVFVFLGIWAGGWSIASRAVTHRFYFAYHATLVGGILVISSLLETFAEYVDFAFALPGLANTFSMVAGTLLFGFLLFSHIRYSTTLTLKKSVRVAAALALGFSVLIQSLVWVFERDFGFDLDYSSTLKAPAFVLRRPVSSTDYFSAAHSLKSDVDELARE